MDWLQASGEGQIVSDLENIVPIVMWLLIQKLLKVCGAKLVLTLLIGWF